MFWSTGKAPKHHWQNEIIITIQIKGKKAHILAFAAQKTRLFWRMDQAEQQSKFRDFFIILPSDVLSLSQFFHVYIFIQFFPTLDLVWV